MQIFNKYILFLIICLPFILNAEIPLPNSNFYPDWTRNDTIEQFTKSDLYGHINGGAELFLEFGFEILTVARYSDGVNELTLEAYQMESHASALGIYLMKCGKGKPAKGITIRNTHNRFQTLALCNNYFVQLNNFEGSDSLLPAVSALLNAFSAKLLPDPKVPIFDWLPAENRITGSELLLRGPYALQKIYTFGPKEILGLGGKHFAFLADYLTPEGESFTWLRINYPNQNMAEKIFKAAQENLDPYLSTLRSDEHSFVFKDYKGEYGLIELEGQSLSLKIHLKSEPK